MGIEKPGTLSKRQTERPYIVHVKGVCSGQPIIKGTRISVRHVKQL